ncbi:hypothetical protein DCAR_0416065 [Daucus carota subsp. sativus]|uniref:1-phosphatidylinositol-3-phosphate 5-kinase n=1 Tax=Daucus carota subsp. sativus TaxID=79200 RepID=A0AAF0WWB9_DAUCS|nr:hypothetical protein DCAR_0416065 [Daucus carota subsp. sativus]
MDTQKAGTCLSHILSRREAFIVKNNKLEQSYTLCVYRGSQEGSSASVQDKYNHFPVDSLRDMSLPSHGNGLLLSNITEKNSHGARTSFIDGGTRNDAEYIQKGNNSESYKERENTHSNKIEMDPLFWLPPETEDHENDMDCSVANYDDDDDEGDDGTKWGRPSSLSGFGEKSCGSYRYEEEKQKAMENVKNCKFKALVYRLLTSAGVACLGKDGDNWADIVTSLSWEAASFVKPDIGEGKAMDPDGYVKVKCVATGSRSESQLVKGMVFKKHAAHKHMPTNYKKPRLLLIQGALDRSLRGLSSFESMKQEKDTLKSIIEDIAKCNPNVILVEKTVSRDIQESILAKGMTVVIDMKLHRLQRVARCTGSLILSSDTLSGKKLRQCNSFHFEKLVEEHAVSSESGKKPSKTLMFLDGCPTRRGCTILLKGTNSEKLKKIKLVVQHAVLMAYHLILETAFLLDQNAMFSTPRLNGLVNMSSTDVQPCFFPSEANAPWSEDTSAESHLLGATDIHIASGFHKEGLSNVGLESDTLYSPVTKYSVSLPPEKLNFSCQISGERLGKYIESIPNLYKEGIEIFLEAEILLKDISMSFNGSKIKIQGSLREFSDIAEMLKQERCQFKDDLEGTIKNWDLDDTVYKVVSLNRVKWDILVASCVWDRRLHSLCSSEITTDAMISDEQRHGQSNVEEDGKVGEEPDYAVKCEKVFDYGADFDNHVGADFKANGSIEVPIEGDIQGPAEQNNFLTASSSKDDIQKLHTGMQNVDSLYKHILASSDISNDSYPVRDAIGDVTDSNLSQRKGTVLTVSSEWIWSPLPEIRYEYMKDLQKGYSLNFKPINSYAQGSRIHDVINDEGSRLHIPLGADNYIVSDHEDELSSVVASALALLRDPPVLVDPNDDLTGDRGVDAKSYERSRSVSRPSSVPPINWPSFGSLSSDGLYSGGASDDSCLLNGLYLSDSLIYFNDMHPEVSMGLSKLPEKVKYSVVSLHASKFRDLRRRCCSSEVDYIASLSRCRNWDAKGGKSKSFFAKTLDDRFIVKEIQRIEYESFLKFAEEYFTYMNDCFEQGNQTCLAKILGIHQVTVWQKSGKVRKHDLMVMENLTFGRSISRQYDLKGALHARLNSAPDGSGEVLLDQNFVDDMNRSPFYVSRQAKRNLQRAVWNDTTFLNSINVMDYSLLVGVDSQKGELVCGIIDYLRQYTWDKHFETWVKSSLVVPKNLLPTVISPKEYKKRFRKFISTHFVSVPDNWC